MDGSGDGLGAGTGWDGSAFAGWVGIGDGR